MRQMEKRGIQTEKGNLNRWIRKANEMLRELKGKVIGLIDWATEVKSEITKPQAPTLADYLALYYDKRNAGAYSNKAKSNNLKDYAATVNFLSGLGLSTLNSFETYTWPQASFGCRRYLRCVLYGIWQGAAKRSVPRGKKVSAWASRRVSEKIQRP